MKTSASQNVDKTIAMDQTAVSSNALLLPDELLSARKTPHPLYAFLAETLESFSSDREPVSFFQTEESASDPELPDADEVERICKNPAENYELKNRIAVGGQGAICSAWDTQFRRTVAVKSLLSENLHTPVRNAFFREAQITAQLQHPGIVPIHNLWVDKGDCPHLAMKLVEGVTLRKRLDHIRKLYDSLPWRKIASRERLLQKERLELFLKVCDTLAYAHSRGVIHRDLKPENIMLGRFGAVYVLDWGIAVPVPEGNGLITSPVYGTPRYVAPEMLNSQPYGRTADIYQMGLILFELVYLRHAYPLVDPAAAVAAGQRGKIAPQEHLYGCRTSELLQNIIAKATAFRPEERYKDIRDLARDVHSYLNQDAVSVDKHPFRSTITRMLMRHSQKLLAVIAVLTLLVFGLISWNLATVLHNERQHEQRESVLRSVYGTYLRNVLTVERRFLELDGLLLQLAREVETRLETLPAPDAGTVFYDHTAWRESRRMPPGFSYAPSRGRNASFEVPLYKFSGKPVPELRSILTALNPMVRSCREVILWNLPGAEGKNVDSTALSRIRTSVNSVFIGLQNGLFLAYPYMGNFPENFDPRTRPWYQEAQKMKSRQVYWTNPYMDDSVGKVVISGSVPLQNRRGDMIGVLGLDLEPDTMIRAFVQRDLTANHVYRRYLLNRTGRIVAADGDWKPSEQLGKHTFFPHMELFPEMQRLKTGRLFLDRDGTQLVIFHYMKALDCFFAEIIDFEAMMSGFAAPQED